MNESVQRAVKYVTVLLVLATVAASWYRPIAEIADAYVDEGLKRSLISFASARALNGVISVLQGTEVFVQPFGLGLSLSLGEILDPVNDLVETFSSVMLTASVAFGVQKLLLSIGSSWAVSVCLSAIALVWAGLFLVNRSPQWLFRVLGVLLFVRFVMPVATIGSAKLFEGFSADEYRASQGALDKTAIDLKVFVPTVDGAGSSTARPAQAPAQPARAEGASTSVPPTYSTRIQGAWQAMARGVEGAVDVVKDPLGGLRRKFDDTKRQYDEIKRSAEAAVEKMISLIVIFLMQTVVVPLLLLLGLYWLCRDLFRTQPGGRWAAN